LGPSDETIELRHLAARIAAGLAVGALYFWIIGIGAENRRFAWNSGLDAIYGFKTNLGLPNHPQVSGSNGVDGYYDLLARAFAQGQLRLPVEPAPELLALSDPWSDRINRPYRLLDTVLYKGHYFLYHGATPALLLFTPWYLATRHDFPENFAAFLFSLGAYLFAAALFVRMTQALSIRLPLWLYTLFLAVLGLCQSVPFLLHRAKVYEVAISCGYFCLSSGFYFLFRLVEDTGRPALWGVPAGLSFGLAMGCRPHLAVAAAAVFALLLLKRLFPRPLLSFTVPVIMCGLALAAYNYARFDNPLEVGTHHLLGDDGYRQFQPSGNLLPGLYYLLICPPDIVPEFPFVRLALRPPLVFKSALPPIYYLEAIAGILCLFPLLLAIPALWPGWEPWRRGRAAFSVLAAMFISAVGAILIIASVPFASQRYEVDFAPYLVFIACIIAAARFETLRRKAARAVTAALVAILLFYSITANLALAIQGPYDQFVQGHPRSWVQLARWFSPAERYRPVLNPVLRVRGLFQFAPCYLKKEPLISLGEFGSRYLLSAECDRAGRIRLISETSFRYPGVQTVDLPFAAPGLYSAGLDFNPASLVMTVTWNGQTVLQHPLRFLMTSRSQIHFGEDPTLGNQETFSGQIQASPPQFFAAPGSQ
jgi:hypothetical protein